MDPYAVEQTPDLSNVPVAALEAVRLRLLQLQNSLKQMMGQIHQANLPSWPALQGQFNVVLTQLTSLSTTIAGCAEELQKTVTYPLPSFPTNTHQDLLSTLLRKKYLPQVEEWVEQGQNQAQDIIIRQDDEFCKWAFDIVENSKDDREWSGFLTREQVDQDINDPGLIKHHESSNNNNNNDGWNPDKVMTFLSKGAI